MRKVYLRYIVNVFPPERFSIAAKDKRYKTSSIRCTQPSDKDSKFSDSSKLLIDLDMLH